MFTPVGSSGGYRIKNMPGTDSYSIPCCTLEISDICENIAFMREFK